MVNINSLEGDGLRQVELGPRNTMMMNLTSEKQGRSSTIQDKSGKCLTEENEILSRWTEYCSELYNYENCGDNAVLDCSSPRKKICNRSSVRKLKLQ